MTPIIADNKPVKVTLAKGEAYTFCTCGRSRQQPFCDGSHVGSDFKPQQLVAEEAGDAYLCQCKHSSNSPFCDGSHKQFDEYLIGKEGPGMDVQFALDATADYIILDGRGGGTEAAPEMFRDQISVPTIPTLARARRYLNEQGASGQVTLIITGGLREPMDFVKAMALGADGAAISNSAMQSIGCVAARICNTNNCPAGIATQKQICGRG